MKKNLFVFLTLCLGLLVSCKEPDGPNKPDVPKEAPTLDLTIDELTSSSITFTIASETANKFGYRVSLASETAPTVEELMSESFGALDKSIQFTVTDLTPNTEYTVYAVVGYDDLYSEVGSLSVTTHKASEDPDFSLIELIDATYSTFKFRINGEENYFKFIPVEKAMLSELNATPQEWIETMGGIVDQGTNEYEWTDGLEYEGYPMSVAPGREYVIIAGLSDASGNLKDGVDTLQFRTPSIPDSDAEVSINFEEITSTTVSAYVNVDASISTYYVYVRELSWFEDIIANYGLDMIKTLIKYPSSGAPSYAQSRSVLWEGLRPQTEYYFAVLGIDAQGNEVLEMLDFTTTEPTAGDPELVISATPNSIAPHSILDLSFESDIAIMGRWAVLMTSEAEELYGQGFTNEDIIETYGTTLSDEEMAQALNGGVTIPLKDLWRSSDYTIVCAVRSHEYVQVTKSITASTTAQAPATPVESSLFEDLLGQWTATYSYQILGGETFTISNIPIEIAAGADEASAQEYRAQNRLVALGFQFQSWHETDPYEFYGPQTLMNEYGFDEDMAYRDYGPKFFFEIHDGDVVTLPTSASDYLAYYTSDKLYFLGCDYSQGYVAPIEFPVVVSSDKNTITIKECVLSSEVYLETGGVIPTGSYRPSIFRNSLTEMFIVATSDIVLTRVQ